MKLTIDTETDSYERACEVVNAAYGRPVHPQLVAPLPLADGEVWRDQTQPKASGWTEEQLRTWVRQLWEVSDAALAIHWICSQAGTPIPSYKIDRIIMPGEGGGTAAFHRRKVWIGHVLRAAKETGHTRMPFTRHDPRRTYTAAPEVARIVLDELSKGPLHSEVLERAALAESGLAEDGM